MKLDIPLDSKDYLSIKAWTTLKQKDEPSLGLKLKNLMRHSLTVFSCTALVLMPVFLPVRVKADPPAGTIGWTNSFEDTFNNGFDTNKWNNTFWWGNGFLGGGSTSYFSPNNVSVVDGHLSLKANREVEAGLFYTGGIATTYGKFYQTYGYFEARVKVPKGAGMGPAFSLEAEDTSWPPEINIMEIPGAKGNNATTVWMTNHYIDANGNVSIIDSEGTWTSSTGLDGDYHTYGLLWQPGLLVWYVDDVERYRTTVGVPDKPCYIILVSGVTFDTGSWAGDPTNTTFPQYMDVQWVRAWRQ